MAAWSVRLKLLQMCLRRMKRKLLQCLRRNKLKFSRSKQSMSATDAEHAMIMTRIDSMLKEVITKVYHVPNKRSSSQALLGFLVRCAGSWKSINTLVSSAPTSVEADAIGNDCAAILRCMFDACIQAAYLFIDPKEREDRARLYLDYEHVERFLLSTEIASRNNPLSKSIAASPLRPEGEKRNRKEFDRVKAKYLVKKSTRPDHVRNTWYRGDLRTLAKTIGKEQEDEYIVFVKRSHGSIHSSRMAVSKGPSITGKNFCYFASLLACRVARMVVENDSLSVTSSSAEMIASHATSPLDIGDNVQEIID